MTMSIPVCPTVPVMTTSVPECVLLYRLRPPLEHAVPYSIGQDQSATDRIAQVDLFNRAAGPIVLF